MWYFSHMQIDPYAERLAVLETKLDALLTNVEDLAGHVEKLRYWKAYLVGAGAVIGAIGAAALELFSR